MSSVLVTENDAGCWIEKPIRKVHGRVYRRYVVRTHLVRPGERLDRTMVQYLVGQLTQSDILVLGEKMVAIAEGRAVALSSVKPRPLARVLARHVRPVGYGLGLKRAETMEMSIRESGSVRIFVAALAGIFDRMTGRSGDFYRVAGRRVAAIDGPGPTTIPPYNQFIVLAPEHPETVIAAFVKRFGCRVAVVDVNDVGSEVLAWSHDTDPALVSRLMRDNPMGQGAQSTPMAVLRLEEKPPLTISWPNGYVPQSGAWVVPVIGSGDCGMNLNWSRV
ncbi:MAG: hypothetical protein C7B45_16580 [Sulfobacillus acidophilus]|uniref:Coenzyme F420:L-glutamate ligase-like domain-containing protein n=1 Tax=Sulfobacillus acidophilus TaxID=53633 RepID=A0A2T2WCY8_9FIRM|nr:MAG: hypothetical protein C7B45_16580 [Sulfobacillus acidophilus]